jgi:integrase
MKASLWYYPNTSKKSKKSGKIPMYMRVIYNGKSETRLNADVTEKELLLWNNGTMRFLGNKIPINITLDRLKTNFDKFINNNPTCLNSYSAKDILNIVLEKSDKPDPTVLEYMDNFFQNVVISNESFAKTTVKGYRKAINHFKKFLVYKRSEKLLISKIDNKLALEFKDYLLATIPTIYKKGMTEPSAHANVKDIRIIIDRAVKEGLLIKNSFKEIKLKSQSPLKPKLNIQQIKELYNLDLSRLAVQQIHRDIFLFSVFTGLSYCDAMKLKQSDLTIIEGGDIKLSLYRKKSEVLAEMVLPKQAIEIMKGYEDYTEVQVLNSVLPNRSNQKINVQLNVIQSMVNIPFRVTTHIARHTFRQLLSEAGITDTGVIKRMMGHSSRRDIDGTYYTVTELGLIKAKRKFELYLENNLNSIKNE